MFHKLPDRVINWISHFKRKKMNKKLTIINVYAPHSQITKKDKNQTEDINNILSDQLKRNTRSTFIAGNFNAATADSNKHYPKNIGLYSKGTTDENGPF